MIPIQELLARIRWDKAFGDASFVLGYYDRVEERIIRVNLRDVQVDPESHALLDIIDAEGGLHTVPLHRVKEVYRNGELIWHRSH
ncbi:DUF504 domain-containing protein [Thioalkalivibrio sulfidiphilus]|uniref:DUF504 domain-containing protein n=1 Tax=Thioalkalivibrio sulfidiphilus TaxID=1033854 RepID=UPI000380AD4C|nr:DUF504 domain-containing protein [Thioalkalivibrio sulfidiphilus]